MLGFLQKLPGTALASADTVGYGVREGKVQKKNKTETGTFQEQITLNEVRRGSSQISELQSILKEISPGCSLEGLMLKPQYFCHMIQRTGSFEKALMLRKIGEDNGNPLQYCCLENPMDRGAW